MIWISKFIHNKNTKVENLKDYLQRYKYRGISDKIFEYIEGAWYYYYDIEQID